MANNFGGQSGGSNVWGSIISALIGAGSTYYSGRQASKAQEESDKRIADANKVAQDRADQAMLDAEARAEEQRKLQATAAAEAAVPVGESATLEFGASPSSQNTGSTIDFLVPKLGSTQLGGTSSTGLGV